MPYVEISFSTLTTYRRTIEVPDGAVSEEVIRLAWAAADAVEEYQTSHELELDDIVPLDENPEN